MATVGHLAIGAGIARIFTTPDEPGATRWRRAVFAAMFATLPDADLALCIFGTPRRGSALEHRGAFHGLVIGPILGVAAWTLGASRRDAACYAVALMSHGLTDTLSASDSGPALLWPASPRRFVSPWRPVPSQALDLSALDWKRWAPVVWREILVFSPAIVMAVWPHKSRPNSG
jgi:membrane-bound metal-dependent hydrolase YbcI (DUF457 family)